MCGACGGRPLPGACSVCGAAERQERCPQLPLGRRPARVVRCATTACSRVCPCAGMSAAPSSLGLLTGGGESSLLSSHQAPDTFPQMPTLPIAFDGLVLGPVEEADSLDGPEYEEEEVEIPLSAPPTNQ